MLSPSTSGTGSGPTTCAPPFRLFAGDLDALAADGGTAEEKARATRFADPRDGHRFLAGRTALRRAVAQVLGEGPALDWYLTHEPAGRPVLRWTPGPGPRTPDPGPSTLHLSHSHDGAAWRAVVSTVGPVGIDRESGARLGDPLALAAVAWPGLDARERVGLAERAAFLRTWTRTEALLKALGTGFLVDLPVTAQRQLVDPAPCHRLALGERIWQVLDLEPPEALAPIALALPAECGPGATIPPWHILPPHNRC